MTRSDEGLSAVWSTNAEGDTSFSFTALLQFARPAMLKGRIPVAPHRFVVALSASGGAGGNDIAARADHPPGRPASASDPEVGSAGSQAAALTENFDGRTMNALESVVNGLVVDTPRTPASGSMSDLAARFDAVSRASPRPASRP